MKVLPPATQNAYIIHEVVPCLATLTRRQALYMILLQGLNTQTILTWQVLYYKQNDLI